MPERFHAAVSRNSPLLNGAVSFRDGCAAIAHLFADLADLDSFVMSVFSEVPAVSVHITWADGALVEALDSRDFQFADREPAELKHPPALSFQRPDRFHVEIRTTQEIPHNPDLLDAAFTYLVPFHEMMQRVHLLISSMDLLNSGLDQRAASPEYESSQAVLEIVAERMQHPVAFIPVANGAADTDAMQVIGCNMSEASASLFFTSVSRIQDGPIQRAISAAASISPVLPNSLYYPHRDNRIVRTAELLGLRDVLTMPVANSGEVDGVLVSLRTRNEDTFTRSDLRLFSALTYVAAWALPLGKQQTSMRRAVQKSELLRHLMQQNSRTSSIEQVLSMGSHIAQLVFEADFVALGRITGDGKLIGFRHVTGNITQLHQDREYLFSNDQVRSWLDNPRFLVLQNIPDIPWLTSDEFPVLVHEQLQTAALAPYPLGDGSAFLMLLGWRSPYLINEDDARFAMAVAQTIGHAI